MYVSESNLTDYLKKVLNILTDKSKDLKEFHANIEFLERVEIELLFYQEVVKSKKLVLLLEDTRCLVEYYLCNRYIVLNNRKVRKVVKKRIKVLKRSITSLKLDDRNLNVFYLKNCINTVLQEICIGTDIRKYEDIIDSYTKLNYNLRSLSNIATDIDMLDEELHFLDTFLNSKFLYLGVQKHRGNLKRIAESLLKSVV